MSCPVVLYVVGVAFGILMLLFIISLHDPQVCSIINSESVDPSS